MNWLFVTLLAQFITGTSEIFDKLLLRRKTTNSWAFTFWVGILGIFALALLPFGFSALSLATIFIALSAGVIFIIALFFLYRALQMGEASSVLPLIGGLSPFFTIIFSLKILNSPLGRGEVISFLFLVAGGILFYFVESKKTRSFVIIPAIVSSVLLGISNVLSKMVFNHSPFITGFIWIKLGGVLIAVAVLVVSSWRKKIFASLQSAPTAHRLWYLGNRFYAGVGSVLISFAISLTHPALVDATQSFRYVVIFLVGWLIVRERFFGKIFWGKLLATTLIIIGILGIGLTNYIKSLPIVSPSRSIQWGLTFSKKQSEFLGLDWRENYQAILKDLKPKQLRLVAYWDEIEKEQNQYTFADLDWQLSEAKKAGSNVVLALGMKVPRWPECHIPAWVGPDKEQREALLQSYIKTLIERYRNESEIALWQVENEPYLYFGECPSRGKNFLENEIVVVRSLDTSRPILTTDGGEFGLWYPTAKRGDVFGTSMYRRVYVSNPGFRWHSFRLEKLRELEYPLGPNYFVVKQRLVRWLLRDPTKKFIVIELQGEPWGAKPIPYLAYEKQQALLSPDYFRSIIDYARRTGFDEYYLWGAEWWYYMGKKYDNWEYWNIAKNVMAHYE